MSLLFSRDVVIDLVGYRKFGHNEIDEPMFTQPIMYSIIKKHKNILELYSEKLINEGTVTKEETKAVVEKYDKICEEAYKKAQEATETLHKHWLDSPWSGFFEGKDPLKIGDTGVHEETLQHIGKRSIREELRAISLMSRQHSQVQRRSSERP